MLTITNGPFFPYVAFFASLNATSTLAFLERNVVYRVTETSETPSVGAASQIYIYHLSPASVLNHKAQKRVSELAMRQRSKTEILIKFDMYCRQKRL